MIQPKSKGKDFQRTQIKDGFDPLTMFKKEHEEKQKQKPVPKRGRSEDDLQEQDPHKPSITVLGSVDDFLQSDRVPANTNMTSLPHSNSKKDLPNDQPFSSTLKPVQFSVPNPGTGYDFFSIREFIKTHLDLMKCETVIDQEEAFYRVEDKNSLGILAMTDYRLVFKFRDEKGQRKFDKMNFHEEYFRIPFFQISKIEKISDKKYSNKYSLEIFIKDTRALKFIILSDNLKFFGNLNSYLFPKDISSFYKFSGIYLESLTCECNYFNGWNIYDPIEEYQRQGIPIIEDDKFKLRLSYANSGYKMCPTYPEVLVVHAAITDDELKEASNFRTKNRLPVLSYYYSKGTASVNGCFPGIWRASQTKSGLTGQNRSLADEKNLKLISELCDKLIIYDARPFLNAFVNRINGGGYENVNNYNNAEIIFCKIENIHNARSSLQKIFALSYNNNIMDCDKFWSTLEQTNWYEFIHLILKYSHEIALSIQKNYSVLIHCSDGWDRSTQLISLSQILIDPYFRTLKGLAALVEKEWLSFGHQFGYRNGIYIQEPNEDQRSPIFLQWLDCIHQLLYQFPNAFEYNMELLLFLAQNYNSNLYGTFMFNSDRERQEKNARTKTASVWSDVFNPSVENSFQKFKNPFYEKDNRIEIICPNYAPYNLKFWDAFFLKFNTSIENDKIFLNENGGKFVKSQHKFFEYHKIVDTLNSSNTGYKMEELMQVLMDVYEKTKDTSIFSQFKESTKFYLGNVKIDIQKGKEEEKDEDI